MNWHLVWRTFLKTWRGYKFIFEIESENPFWPGGQNYLEMKHRNDLDKCLNFSIFIFPSKDAWWSIMGQYIKCLKNKYSWEKIWMHKKTRNYVRIKIYKQSENAVYIKLRKKICILAKTCINSRVHMSRICFTVHTHWVTTYMLQPIHY